MKLIQGDCLEEMKHIESGSVDMVLTDPPYGTTACKWDAVIPLDAMWEQLKRIIKPNGAIVMTASQPFTSALIMSNPKWFKYCWVWEKNRSTGHVHAKNRPMKKHEDVVVFSEGNTLHKSQSKKRMPYYPQGLVEMEGGVKRRTRNDAGNDAVMGARKSHKSTMYTHTGFPVSVLNFDVHEVTARVHHKQKPDDLMEYLIKTYTEEGQLVMDFTMGSGTTGVACKRLRRDFIGIERKADPGEVDYFDIACKRIDQALARV